MRPKYSILRIAIRVKPNSKNESVAKNADGSLTVRVKAPAKEGKANDAVVETLGEYFGLPKSRVRILRGESGKNKVVEIS
jgi:uncharacterized protein (TIGR00251 family)